MNRSLTIGVVCVLLVGCSYEDEVALRSYNGDLATIRVTINELQRLQPRVVDKVGADKIRSFAAEEILSRARLIVGDLRNIDNENPHISKLNQELISIWSTYALAFEEFVEDLTEQNLERKRRRVREALEGCDFRWRIWNAQLQTFHEKVVGWSG